MADIKPTPSGPGGIRLPAMRDEVVGALKALSNRDYQQRVWIEHRLPKPNYYDELKLEIHILFDDIDVCVDPDRWVGGVLLANETGPFRPLGDALVEMLEDPTLVSDADYLADPRWGEVIRLAQAALAIMKASEDGPNA